MLLADTVRHLVPLDHSIIVTADSVSNLYWTSPPDTWHLKDYPSVMPPFDNLWIECNAPQFKEADGDFLKRWPRDMPSQWGCLISTAEGKLHAALSLEGFGDLLDSERKQADAEQTRWTVAMTLFVKFPHLPAFEVVAWFLGLGRDGRVITYHDDLNPDGVCYLGTLFQSEQLPEGVEAHAGLYSATRRFYATIFLTLSFMHCRNVSLLEQQPNAKENKLHLKRGKPTLLTYKTLVIDHMKEVLRSEGGMAKGNSLKRAIHICRGYFAHYTAEKPLFGRTVGTFWVPQHVRGTPKRGIVSKTYEVR